MTDRLQTALVLAIFWLAAKGSQAGLVGEYTFDGDSLSPSSVATNLSLSVFGYSGSDATPGFVGTGAARGYSTNGWPTNTTRDDNFNFTIAIAPGFSLAMESIVFDEVRSASGPRAAAVTIEGSELELFAMPDDTITRTQTADQNVASFSALTGSVAVRFFGTESELSSGTWRLNNVQINGTVSAVPEPSAFFLIGLSVSGVASLGVVRRICWRSPETASIN